MCNAIVGFNWCWFLNGCKEYGSGQLMECCCIIFMPNDAYSPPRRTRMTRHEHSFLVLVDVSCFLCILRNRSL
jgi:hypothetical protein